MNGRLMVDFCGEERVLEPAEELTFGRCGGLSIDDNPYLHRVVGRFVHRSGTWWLDHLGRRAPLTVRDANGPTVTTVAPGATLALGHAEFALTFSAGPTHYEILGALEDREWEVDLLGPDGLDGTRTLDWGRVELNADQRLLLVAMCESRLVDPRSAWRDADHQPSGCGPVGVEPPEVQPQAGPSVREAAPSGGRGGARCRRGQRARPTAPPGGACAVGAAGRRRGPAAAAARLSRLSPRSPAGVPPGSASTRPGRTANRDPARRVGRIAPRRWCGTATHARQGHHRAAGPSGLPAAQ